MASVRLRNLNKIYPDGFHAVKDVNVDIADGEFVVLVGPSGCGKSTTLRMIAGLEEPSSGDLLIGDRRVNDLEPGERDIAMVFQNYALYPHMTVRQNMEFGLKMRRTPKAEITARVNEAAEMLSITHLLDRRPKEMSGGQRQRVALGRAIVRYPAAFLFDEPLSNLDAKLRVQMRTEIAGLHQRLRATMVYVTHDQVEAMTLGDRLVLMRDGVVQQIAPPLEVYHKPANRFVATFIGSPAMNLFEGAIHNGAFRLKDIASSPVPVGSELADGTAVLGVRPEDLVLGAPDHQNFVTGVVQVVELLGHEALLHVKIGSQLVVVRSAALNSAEPGATVALAVREGRVHVFAGDEVGRRLN